MVLKIVQSPANVGWVDMGDGDDQTHWNYWRRELLLYQSGLLETLPEGMAAPRCYGVAELPGNFALLWLEDVSDSYGNAWPLERYALTARHLGRLNGMYLSEHAAPTFPWFSRQRSRQWLTIIPPPQTVPWEHPLVLVRYPRPEVNTFRQMLLEHEQFLSRLDLLPKTVCHGDTYPTNFMSRYLVDGQEQTVALDWALTGIEPLGDDLGQLVFGAHTNLPDARREDVTEMLFEQYTAGLRDSGCHVDSQLVRFGFATTAALRVGLFQVYLLSEELKQYDGRVDDGRDRMITPDCFEVTMANEAYRLLESIW
ncbi:MAG TPA: phosphotransferase [Chloroflexota bacterium]|nr:phosphotransferase [Chloroflexota bacterium]